MVELKGVHNNSEKVSSKFSLMWLIPHTAQFVQPLVHVTREKKPHFVGFFFARCARKLMSGTLVSSEILEFGLFTFTSPFYIVLDEVA